MTQRCFLCSNRRDPINNILLHSFPNDETQKQKWLTVCGLSPNEDVKNTRICSAHFSPLAYKGTNKIGQVARYLKSDAVPLAEVIIPETSVHPAVPTCTLTPLDTRPKRRFADPRFISEIDPSEITTPERANSVVNLIKRTDQKKSKTIKALQDQRSYLKKKIACLEKLVQQLRHNAVSDENEREVEETDEFNIKSSDDDDKNTNLSPTNSSLATPYTALSNADDNPEFSNEIDIKIETSSSQQEAEFYEVEQSTTDKTLQGLKEEEFGTAMSTDPPEQTEFDHFGETIACQLKRLPETLALQSMAHIQSYLVEQRLKAMETNINH